jgi:hypothetical protein
MPNGFGYRGGWGFGFRGSSPPWPYVGLGRGGLPRCGYFLAGTPVAPDYAPYYGAAWDMPYAATPDTTPFAPQMTREQEIDFLRNEAEALSENLEQIEARINELEAEG